MIAFLVVFFVAALYLVARGAVPRERVARLAQAANRDPYRRPLVAGVARGGLEQLGEQLEVPAQGLEQPAGLKQPARR